MAPKSRQRSDDDSDSNIQAPPPPSSDRVRSRKRRSRYRAYSEPRERKRADVTIVICVWHGSAMGWRTAPITFDKYKTTDEELWSEIRATYRDDLQKAWRRIFLLKHLRHIMPIEFSKNDVPIRQDPKDVPGAHEFMHCFRHPDRIRTERVWVKWFIEFDATAESKTYGLEFVEGIWAEKLAIFAILVNIAIITVSVVWALKGGELQTVFSVMGFVLTAAAADVALVALYYQVTLPG